jgi:organic radical activating enzyme
VIAAPAAAVGPAGFVQEVFASFQGEGTHVGRRTVFVRTAGCSLRCRFCDTPKALVRTEFAEFHRGTGADELVRVKNPVTVAQVAAEVDRLDPARRAWVSFTGGEPLEQVDFLIALAPALGGRPIHLETAGVHAPEMAKLRPHVAFVDLDLKLDSVAHEGDRTAEHRAFLAASRGVDRIAKAVIGPTTDLAELDRLCALVGAEDPAIPIVLQPETPRGGGSPELPRELLERAHDVAAQHVKEVRVIPQTHKFLRLP